MANTYDSDLYGKAIATGALRVMQSDVKPLSVFSTNFSPDPANRYENVRVPLTSAPGSSSDKSRGSAYSVADTTVSERSITLTSHKYQSWHVEDIDDIKSQWANIENIGIEKTQALIIDVFQDILSVVTAAKFGNTASDKLTVAASAFDRDDLVDLAGLCDNENWPDIGRNVLLKPDHWRAVTKDGATAADVYGSAMIRQSSPNGIPMEGFSGVWRCNSIPANSENLVGFAALPRAIAIANRYLAPAGGGDPASIYNPIVDGETGLTLGYRQFYNNLSGQMEAIIESLYGYVEGETNSIKRVVSA